MNTVTRNILENKAHCKQTVQSSFSRKYPKFYYTGLHHHRLASPPACITTGFLRHRFLRRLYFRKWAIVIVDWLGRGTTCCGDSRLAKRPWLSCFINGNWATVVPGKSLSYLRSLICYLFTKNGECVEAGGCIGRSWGSAMHLCLRAGFNM